MDIGSKLKEIRTLKGLTQEELADRAELSKGFISQLERNLTSPSIATLTDILQCLGTTLGEFFNETPEEPHHPGGRGLYLPGQPARGRGIRLCAAGKHLHPPREQNLPGKEGRVLLLYPGQEALPHKPSRRIADLGQHAAQLLNHPACSPHTARLQHTKS